MYSLILFFKQYKSYFMGKMLSKKKKVARLIQNDITLKSRPFSELADTCGSSEEDVLDITKTLLKEGFMRKFGAILRHQKIGYGKNALVVWSVPADQIEKVGEIFASFPFISHCYERKPAFQTKYNLFTMLHAKGEDTSDLVNNMAASAGINDYLILESLTEYKKISPEYF
jgi:DNA-binding Lrp family transcriptional regulator